MRVTVIGGNGSFNEDDSSFLIETSSLSIEPVDTIKILFDCGCNAFNYYKKNLKEVDYVFISHTHFDHIGGLESLIFYRYYMQGGKTTRIIAGDEVKKELEIILKDCNKFYDDGKIIGIPSFEIVTEIDIPTYDIELIKGNHIVKPNYGLLIKDKPEDLNFGTPKALFISGDTKASEVIRNKLQNLVDEGFSLTVFHDLSFWDDEKYNIHCCPTDFKRVYFSITENQNVKWYNYHNNEFNSLYKNKIFQI